MDGTVAADPHPDVGQQPPRPGSAPTAVQAVGAFAIIASAVWMPWATYKQTGSRVTSHLSAGQFAVVLIGLGALVVALAAVYVIRPSRWLATASLACGAAALITAIAAGATRIAHANSLTVNTGGTTRFGVGLGITCLAAVAIAASAAVEMARRSADRSEGSRR